MKTTATTATENDLPDRDYDYVYVRRRGLFVEIEGKRYQVRVLRAEESHIETVADYDSVPANEVREQEQGR